MYICIYIYIYIYRTWLISTLGGITIPYPSQPPSPTRAHPKRAQRRFFLRGAPLPVSARASHLGWRWCLPHDPPLSRHRFFVTHAEMGGPGPSIQFGSPFSGFARFSFFSGPGFFICTWGYVAVLSFVRCFFCVKGGSTVTAM